MCKVYTRYHGTREIEQDLCACTVDNPVAKARGLSLHIGAQTILYLSLISYQAALYRAVSLGNMHLNAPDDLHIKRRE